MDHLTLAFEQAVQNLNLFLDSIASSLNSPHAAQLCVAGISTVLVDYFNLLEACCVSHPGLKTRINAINQKLINLQTSGTLLPPPYFQTIASFSASSNCTFPPPMMGSMIPPIGQSSMTGYFQHPGYSQQMMPSMEDSRFSNVPYRINMRYAPPGYPMAPHSNDFYQLTPPSISTPSPPMNSAPNGMSNAQTNDIRLHG